MLKKLELYKYTYLYVISVGFIKTLTYALMDYFCPCFKFNPHRLQKRSTQKKVQHRVGLIKTVQRQKKIIKHFFRI